MSIENLIKQIENEIEYNRDQCSEGTEPFFIGLYAGRYEAYVKVLELIKCIDRVV